MKKLFVVTISIEVEALVLAESSSEAEDAEDEIMRTEGMEDKRMVTVRELKSRNGQPQLPEGWDDNCLVYGAEEDTTLAEALAQVTLEDVEQKKLL